MPSNPHFSLKKSIAISACLLGHPVRYDGKDQAHAIIIAQLIKHFTIIPVCPEVEIGLGVPREKIALYQCGEKIQLLSCGHPVQDLTELMVCYADTFLQSNQISGMILKDKSPSCGVGNCKKINDSEAMQADGTGIFAATIMQLKPGLPMLQSCDVRQEKDLDLFISKVKSYEY